MVRTPIPMIVLASLSACSGRVISSYHVDSIVSVGDSITTAELADGEGFRGELARFAADRGLDVSQQGPFTTGAANLYHSAQSGNTCEQMRERVNSNIGLGPGTPYADAKLVSLFAGTNGHTDAQQTAADYEVLLADVYAHASASVPDVHVLVTTITPISGSTFPEQLNGYLPGVWQRHESKHPGTLLYWDAAAVFRSAEYAQEQGWSLDGTHPSVGGYRALAQDVEHGMIQAVSGQLGTNPGARRD